MVGQEKLGEIFSSSKNVVLIIVQYRCTAFELMKELCKINVFCFVFVCLAALVRYLIVIIM